MLLLVLIVKLFISCMCGKIINKSIVNKLRNREIEKSRNREIEKLRNREIEKSTPGFVYIKNFAPPVQIAIEQLICMLNRQYTKAILNSCYLLRTKFRTFRNIIQSYLLV